MRQVLQAESLTEGDPHPELVLLDLAKIRKDGGTQGRVALDTSVIAEYAELMKANVKFPPLRVWFDGNDYWLTDGFQRLSAAARVGLKEFAAEVFYGSLEDAKWDSFGANKHHGLRRTGADVRAIVRQALKHSRCNLLSTNQISRHLGIPEATLRRWRKTTPSDAEDRVRVVVRRGRSYAMDIAKIGKKVHRGGRHRCKSQRDLRNELNEMKVLASPTTRRILNVLGNWILGCTAARGCLQIIEGVIQEIEKRT